MNRLLGILCYHTNTLPVNCYRHAILNGSTRRLGIVERSIGSCSLLCNKTEAKNPKQSKTNAKPVNKITLLALNQSITITTLEEALKLAKRRDLHLVQVQEKDKKAQRPVYKLVKAADLLANELEELKEQAASAENDKNSQKKSEKSLTMGSRIAEHDLQSRIKNITKWLAKQQEVHVLIQANSVEDMTNCERIAKTIEQAIKDPTLIGKIVQKRNKGTNMKFNIVPLQASDGKTQPKPS